jgi:SAM-dependent methyltransferase
MESAEYGPSTYGERIAGVYDTWVAPRVASSTEQAVALLAELAGDGPVLELGIGTGRLALPLAQRGLAVHGIDASQAMLARLRDKPGGADLPVTVGDFAEVGVEDRFALIYVVFNTFFALLDQAQQVRCFRNVAAHLLDGGRFVIEAFVPDPSMFDRGQRVSAIQVELDRVQLNATQHDPVRQRVTTQNVLIGKEGIVLFPVQLRYAWPSELDLMAALAELQLEARFGGWGREAFGASSPTHVSVYRRPAAG